MRWKGLNLDYIWAETIILIGLSQPLIQGSQSSMILFATKFNTANESNPHEVSK